MALNDLDRFLIALAKFLGENPTKSDPLDDVLVCERWHLEEMVGEIIPKDNEFKLDLEIFNRLMIICGRPLATTPFYDYFFKKARTLDDFEQSVENFRVKAMWIFGNFEFGYKTLATIAKKGFESLIQKTEAISPDVFESRPEFRDIESIPEEDLYLLGYISSGELDHLDFSKKLFETLIANPQKFRPILDNLGSEKQKKLSDLLEKNNISFSFMDATKPPVAALEKVLKQLSAVYDPLKARLEKSVEVGTKNTHRYLTLPDLDVYAATSMRTPKDYIEQHQFIKRVFDDPQVAPLNLRYFDPTLSYVDNRISKGLVEMLMLQRANVTIYNAGAEDTLGKDSELAATLAQGKAVIVYVPLGSKTVPLQDGRIINLDK